MTRTIALTERRPREVQLPRREVDFLLGAARHLIDLTPTFNRGTYTLTPRGSVGVLAGPTARYLIRPKIPWPNLLLLLGLGETPAGEPHPPGGELLCVLATAFADRLDVVARTGLVGGFGEVESVSPFLRGRLRAADQMRDAASRAFPGHFHIDEPTFDLDTPWNRVAKATATALLTHPELPVALRDRVAFSARSLAGVPECPFAEADLDSAVREPRAAGYRPLLDVCGFVARGLAGADLARRVPGGFLLDLGHALESYVARSLRDALAARPAWSVEEHPGFTLGPVTLRPDLLVRKSGSARFVLDAKWKVTALDPADLHQVLAYATLTGAPRVGLIYPGRSDARATFVTSEGRVRVTRYRLRVVGTAADLDASVTRLARTVRER